MMRSVHALIDRTIDKAANNDDRWRDDFVLFFENEREAGVKLLEGIGFTCAVDNEGLSTYVVLHATMYRTTYRDYGATK